MVEGPGYPCSGRGAAIAPLIPTLAVKPSSADFLDVEHHPTITFKRDHVEVLGANDAVVTGELTIRGVTRTVAPRVRYLGQWQTSWWEDGVDKGPKTRAGFVATTTIDRLDFGVIWNAPLANQEAHPSVDLFLLSLLPTRRNCH